MLLPMNLDPQALLTSLSDATRLRLIYLFARRGELCVCQLVTALDCHQPKVSKHLGILRKKAIIVGRREGQWIHYRINPDLHVWANNTINELVLGCCTRSPHQEDEARLLETPPISRCA